MDSEPPESEVRKIIHVDMDAFYASVEQRDNPELRGRPVAVGGERERGVVAAASYEARKFGIRSAMPSVTARRKCPQLVFVRPRFDVYRQVSNTVRSVFARYTDLIEPLALDEASLDVTDNRAGIALARDIAKAVRAEIYEETGLTSSAGVSYNKFLAKMASGMRKPNGQFVIPPEAGEAFVASLEIGKFHGIGPATAAKMKALGIETGADLKGWSLDDLVARFGKAGRHYHDLARGIDRRRVVPDRVRKSLGAEETFSSDIDNFLDARRELGIIVVKVARSCAQRELAGRTVTVKVKYADFTQVTRSRSVRYPVKEAGEMLMLAENLLESLFPLRMPLRLIGLSVSSFEDEAEQETEDVRQLALAL